MSYFRIVVALVVAVTALGAFMGQAWGQTSGGDIELLSSGATGEFPEGIRFDADVRSSAEIEEIAVRFRIGQRTVGAYEYLEADESGGGESVRASVFYRTNTAARYIAPGTIITYNFEIEDVNGNRLDTEPAEFIYHDGRYEWDEVSNGIVTVSYHGPVSFRAQDVLDAIVETLGIMGPLLGAGVDEPIRVTMYNNWPEMREALPPSSAVSRRQLVTEGQAHSEEGVLLVLGGAARARGIAAHEVTHILVHRAGEGVLGNVPSWLNEGLAEYGNLQPGESYDNALEFAIRTDNLLPITAMAAQPGNPQDVIIFYGQARSIVRFMVEEYGEEKMRELMVTMKSGKSARTAVPLVYGVTLIELENLWRDKLGVAHRQAPDEASALPTPLPTPKLELFSLDSLRDKGNAEATAVPAPAPAAPLPTVTPAPVAAAVSTATATPAPAARAERPAATASNAGGSADRQPEGEPRGSGACGAPVGGSAGAVEMSSVAILVGVAWLWARRRRG